MTGTIFSVAALSAAEEDEARNDSHDSAAYPAGDVEGAGAALGNGVGLYHGAHEAECENDGNGEKACEELAELAFERSLYIVHGAAGDAAVSVNDTGLLSQNGLGIDGSHAEECDYPHPEDCARAADKDSAASTNNVAGTDLSGNSGGQRLERAHAAFMLIAFKADVSEHLAPCLAEAADLDESGLYREPEAAADEQENEHVVGQISVYLTYNFVQFCFHLSFLQNKKTAEQNSAAPET